MEADHGMEAEHMMEGGVIPVQPSTPPSPEWNIEDIQARYENRPRPLTVGEVDANTHSTSNDEDNVSHGSEQLGGSDLSLKQAVNLLRDYYQEKYGQ